MCILVRFSFSCPQPVLANECVDFHFSQQAKRAKASVRFPHLQHVVVAKLWVDPKLPDVPAPAGIFVYKPKDLNRDWSPRFSTLRDKNGWIRAKTARN